MTRRRLPRVAELAMVVALGTGCDYGDIAIVDPPLPGAVPVELVIESAEGPVAELLGWTGRRIPGAELRIAASDPDVGFEVTGTTDGDGRFVLDSVPPGEYRVSVSRFLDPDERQTVSSDGAVGFLLESGFSASPTTSEHRLAVPAARTGSLMISEMRFQSDRTPEGACCYNFGTYLELYNNADTVIFLDGKIIGEGFSAFWDFSTRPCASEEFLRADGEGIWSGLKERFPGSGTDYPLLPGETTVVALDAIDHRPFAPTAPDLSNADFESRGLGDVDNPAVPDMIDVGLRQPPHGRGLQFRHGLTFVADAVSDVESLPVQGTPGTGLPYRRIPADRILDVAVVANPIAEVGGVNFPLCSPLIHANFGTGFALPQSDPPTISLQRRVLTVRDGGRAVLQWTRSSATDWAPKPRTPGYIPLPMN